MALTPAQLHRQKVLAELATKAAQAAGGDPHGAPQGSEYELMLAALSEHRRKLADIQSVEKKEAYKVVAVKEFDGWVDGVMASEHPAAADEVFATMLAWNSDAGNYARAVDMAELAIKHSMDMPDQFKRTPAAFIVDEISNAALSGKISNRDEAIELIGRVGGITGDCDMADQIKAKLCKAAGYVLVGRTATTALNTERLDPKDAANALYALRRALKLNNASGVKKDIERLERYLKRVAPELLQNPVLPAPTAAQGEDKG